MQLLSSTYCTIYMYDIVHGRCHRQYHGHSPWTIPWTPVMDDAVESSMGDAVDDARASPMVDAIASSMDEPTDENHGTMPRRRLWTMPFRVAMDDARYRPWTTRRTAPWTNPWMIPWTIPGVVHGHPKWYRAMDHGRRHRRTMAWTISFRFVYGAVDGVVHAMVRL